MRMRSTKLSKWMLAWIINAFVMYFCNAINLEPETHLGFLTRVRRQQLEGIYEVVVVNQTSLASSFNNVACKTESECGETQYCTSGGSCGNCYTRDGCCALEVEGVAECPETCNCTEGAFIKDPNCNSGNWCKEECGHLDECEDDAWAKYDCPSSENDCTNDGDCYCRVVGMGPATIVFLIVCSVLLVYIVWWCCIADVDSVFGHIVDRAGFQSRNPLLGSMHYGRSYGAVQPSHQEETDIFTQGAFVAEEDNVAPQASQERQGVGPPGSTVEMKEISSATRTSTPTPIPTLAPPQLPGKQIVTDNNDEEP